MIDLKLQLFGGRGSGGGRGRSGKTGGGGKVEKTAEQKVEEKIDALPKETANANYTEAGGDMRMNPIPSSREFNGDYDEFRDYVADLDPGAFSRAKVQEIPVADLYTVQDTVNANTMKGIVSKHGVDGAVTSKGLGDNGITVVKYRGEYVVMDGNHRAAIAKLAGKKTIRAEVVRK